MFQRVRVSEAEICLREVKFLALDMNGVQACRCLSILTFVDSSQAGCSMEERNRILSDLSVKYCLPEVPVRVS